MRVQRIAVGLTALNLLLLMYLVAQTTLPAVAEEPAALATPDVLPKLRTRELEIVDAEGRVRALLAVMPPARVDGKDYPETVLLRLIDPQSGPVVKLTAAKDGAGLLLSDDADGGLRLMARDSGNEVQVFNRDGTQR
jgi:hypothetical protein